MVKFLKSLQETVINWIEKGILVNASGETVRKLIYHQLYNIR